MKGLTRGPVPSLTPLFVSLQSVHQAAAAADCHEGHPEELCGLPEAEELAVVEALHQGTVCVCVCVCVE